ncbi:uncharacterized protein LOC134271982 isoform X1 [Saccostrea cucullata]|uniref:uncharacterized protein LOC134271982 isoform X1 n=1 Tax=Saccostrea cuccullata TaxID=36930 RepID=UPI002ED62642
MLFYFLLELILIGNIVYGLECPDGQFGDNCEGNCSSCPFLETCDTVSGQCNVIIRSPDSITWHQSKPFLLSVIASLSISVGLNLALILWKCSKIRCKRKKEKFTPQ